MHFHNSTQNMVTAQIIFSFAYSDLQFPSKQLPQSTVLYLASRNPFPEVPAVSFCEILERCIVPIPHNEFYFSPCIFHTSFSSIFCFDLRRLLHINSVLYTLRQLAFSGYPD